MNDPSSGSAQVPRGERGTYDRGRILSVAVELFNERGYEATSISMLAQKLGISKSAIYYHVESKEHLLKLALDVALNSLEAVLARIENFDGSAQEKLEYAIRGSIQVICKKIPFVTLLLRVRGNTDIELAARRSRRDFDRRLAEAIRVACEEDIVRRDLDPQLVSRLLFGMINSLVEWYDPRGKYLAEDISDTLIALLFRANPRQPLA